VSIEELKSLLREQGWNLDLVTRGKNKRFAYAKKRQGRRVLTRYLKAESKLSELTKNDVLARMTLTAESQTLRRSSSQAFNSIVGQNQ